MGVNFKIPKVVNSKGFMFSLKNFNEGDIHIYWLPNQVQQDVDSPSYQLPTGSPFPKGFPALKHPKVVRVVSETNAGSPGMMYQITTTAFTFYLLTAECEGGCPEGALTPGSPCFIPDGESFLVEISGSYTFQTNGTTFAASPIPATTFNLKATGGTNTPFSTPTTTTGSGGFQIVPGIYSIYNENQIISDFLSGFPDSSTWNCPVNSTIDPQGPFNTQTDMGQSFVFVGGAGMGNPWRI